jgi:hypothetical protein
MKKGLRSPVMRFCLHKGGVAVMRQQEEIEGKQMRLIEVVIERRKKRRGEFEREREIKRRVGSYKVQSSRKESGA